MKTMLGEAQLEWLLAGLAASTATWKLICTSVHSSSRCRSCPGSFPISHLTSSPPLQVPLSYPTGWPRPQDTGYDGWADGSSDSISGPEAELLRILTLIHEASVANVVFISGDVHFPFCISYDPFKTGRPLVHGAIVQRGPSSVTRSHSFTARS